MKKTDLSIIGFSGAREGMTSQQKAILKTFFSLNKSHIKEIHMGMCCGSDDDICDIALAINPQLKIVGHPPIDKKFIGITVPDKKYPEKDYLDRNTDIVKECTFFIATPKSSTPQRSGTWSTINKALKAKKDNLIILPNGTEYNK